MNVIRVRVMIFVGSMLVMLAAGAATDHLDVPAGFDFNQAFFWLSAISTLGQALLWVYVWNANRNRVSEYRIHKIELKLVELEGRLNAVPSHNQMGELYQRVGDIDGDMKAANATLRGIDTRMESFEKIAGRIEKFLLDQAESKSRGKR